MIGKAVQIVEGKYRGVIGIVTEESKERVVMITSVPDEADYRGSVEKDIVRVIGPAPLIPQNG